MAYSQHLARRSQDRFVQWLRESKGESGSALDQIAPAGRPPVQLPIKTAGDTGVFSAVETSLEIVHFYSGLANFFLNIISQCFKGVKCKYTASLKSNSEFLKSGICNIMPQKNGLGPGWWGVCAGEILKGQHAHG